MFFITYTFVKFCNETKTAAINAAFIAEIHKRFQSCKQTKSIFKQKNDYLRFNLFENSLIFKN